MPIFAQHTAQPRKYVALSGDIIIFFEKFTRPRKCGDRYLTHSRSNRRPVELLERHREFPDRYCFTLNNLLL